MGPDNDAAILAAANTASRIICAWGAGAPSRIRVAKVIQILSEFGHGAKLHCLGKTAGGHPRHPLYVPASQPLEPFP